MLTQKVLQNVIIYHCGLLVLYCSECYSDCYLFVLEI